MDKAHRWDYELDESQLGGMDELWKAVGSYAYPKLVTGGPFTGVVSLIVCKCISYSYPLTTLNARLALLCFFYCITSSNPFLLTPKDKVYLAHLQCCLVLFEGGSTKYNYYLPHQFLFTHKFTCSIYSSPTQCMSMLPTHMHRFMHIRLG